MRIDVQFDEVRQNGALLKSDANTYDGVVNRIFSRTSTIQASWQGSDAQAFVSQIESYRPVLNEMREVVENYGIMLEKAADAYMNLQNQRTASARML